MGNYCARSEPADSVTKPRFSLGKDYTEIEGQFAGEGVKKTLAWKATITRLQLESKRAEFWQTRAGGRRNIWLVIKNAIEADHQTAALLLQMSGIVIKGENITVLEDTNGNIYEIPPFIINDPLCFSDERKKAVPKQIIKENWSSYWIVFKVATVIIFMTLLYSYQVKLNFCPPNFLEVESSCRKFQI